MLYEMFSRTAARYPDSLAVVAEDGTTLTFSELRAAADAFGETLVTSGVSPGDHVVVVLPNSPAFVVSALAVARVHAVLVPLNPGYEEPELRYYFRECQAAAVITNEQHAASCERVQRSLGLTPRLFTDVAQRQRRSLARADTVAGSAPALCQYSSGSTGLPKPIVRTHAQLVAEAEHFVATVGLQAGERILTVVPLFHAHGFGNCFLAAARAGATLVLLTAFHRRRVIASIKEQRATLFPGVPFMFGILASSGSIAAEPFPLLRLVFSAGAALPRDVFNGFRDKFGIEVRQLYGSTETGSVSINLGDCAGDRWASVGRPMRDVELRVVDPWGRLLAPGERGEILVRSAATASGYRGLDAATTDAFRDGFYWTSDLGHCDDEGNLFLTGRTTIFIDTGGHKVDPIEVEQVLDQHPKVAQSVVVGVKGRYGRQLVKAVIVAREPCTAEEIASWCRGRLADFKIPRILEFRREIPVSPLGKILRKYLQEIG